MYSDVTSFKLGNYFLSFKFTPLVFILILLSILSVSQPSPPSENKKVSSTSIFRRTNSETTSHQSLSSPTLEKLSLQQLTDFKAMSSSSDEIKIDLNQSDMEKMLKELLNAKEKFTEAKEKVYTQLFAVTEFLILFLTLQEESTDTNKSNRKPMEANQGSLTSESILSDPEFTFFTQFFAKKSWVSDVLMKTREAIKQEASQTLKKEHYIQTAWDYWVLNNAKDEAGINTMPKLKDGILRIPFQPFFNALKFLEKNNLKLNFDLRVEECLYPVFLHDHENVNLLTLKRVFDKVLILIHEYQSLKLYSSYYKKLYSRFLNEIESMCTHKKDPRGCKENRTPIYIRQEFFFPYYFKLDFSFKTNVLGASSLDRPGFILYKTPTTLVQQLSHPSKPLVLPPEKEMSHSNEASSKNQEWEKKLDSTQPFDFTFDEKELDRFDSFAALDYTRKIQVRDMIKKYHYKYFTFALSFIMDFLSKNIKCSGTLHYGTIMLFFSKGKSSLFDYCCIKYLNMDELNKLTSASLWTDYLHQGKLEQILNALLQSRLEIAYLRNPNMDQTIINLKKYGVETEFSKNFIPEC